MPGMYCNTGVYVRGFTCQHSALNILNPDMQFLCALFYVDFFVTQ